MTKRPKDIIQLDEMENVGPVYVPGWPMQWVLTYGWVVVGFYVRHESPLRVVVAHANYYQNAGKTHAQLALEGGGTNTTWRYMGTREINVGPHCLHCGPYYGEVPRGPLLQ